MISDLPQQLQDFVTLCERCETVQRDVLLDILRTNADSERGRSYGFSTIDDSERFRKTVKPTTWHDIAADAERLKHGEGDLLFPGKPPYFICTSGTTGNIKIVPESEPGRALKTLTGRLRIEAIARHLPQMMQGKLLPLVNRAVIGYTEAGIPYGSASGIALATTSETIMKMVAFPMATLDIDYCDTMDYILMRFAVAEDVRAIFGNNAGRIAQLIHLAETKADLLIDDIEIELSGKPENPQAAAPAIADNLEKIIQSETLIYPIFRKQKLLAPLRVTLMKRGWQAALYEERTRNGHSRTQVKLPLLYTDIPAPQFTSDSLLEGT